jgi:hypothetical protein
MFQALLFIQSLMAIEASNAFSGMTTSLKLVHNGRGFFSVTFRTFSS